MFNLLLISIHDINIFQIQKFSVNGQWTDWQTWGECSVPCGTGNMRRTRTCTNPAPYGGGATCEGSGHEERTCSLKPVCRRRVSWDMWSAWSECSAACGGGTRSRSRDCSPHVAECGDTQIKDCNTKDCASRPAELRVHSPNRHPKKSPQLSSKVPLRVKVDGKDVCLLGDVILGQSYTLLDTQNVQMYGVLKEVSVLLVLARTVNRSRR